MNVQIIQSEPIPVVMLRHTGPYEQLAPKFDQLWGWVTANGVPVQRTLGIYWDNPEFTPAHQLRSAACVEVPVGYSLGDTGGLALELQHLPSGEYATYRYVGPYEAMEPVYGQLINHIENTLGRGISDNPAFEVYVNDPSETPADQLITDIFMPLS
ncbi:MAG: GyrI-like domain-containing protein [Chthonomonas sp.]|nr:GyrI-like domain-containing protein [Chthonomonas sp.]